MTKFYDSATFVVRKLSPVLGKLIVDVRVGETVKQTSQDNRVPAAVALCKRGGKTHAAKLSKKQRVEIAKRAAKQR